MYTIAEEQLDFSSITFSYSNPEQGDLLKSYSPSQFDIIVAFFDKNHDSNSMPFKYDASKHSLYLSWYYRVLDSFTRLIKNDGTLYVYGLPQWLPYFSVYLDEKKWQFKYWISLATSHPQKTNVPMVRNHEAILLYVKDKKNFNLRKIRTAHPKCPICGDFTADWGGKKHLRHPHGYAISDVWDDLPNVKNDNHILSKEVWERLILLTAKNNASVLCAAYEGEQDLEKYIFE
jgi:site-specific DNA-methyltransferase (adenine-specific)